MRANVSGRRRRLGLFQVSVTCAEVLAELLVAPIRLAADRLGREGRGLEPRVGGIIAERFEFLERLRNPILIEHPETPAGILLAKLGGHTKRQKMVGQGPGRVFLAQGPNLAQRNVPQTVSAGRAERSPGPCFPQGRRTLTRYPKYQNAPG